MGKHRFELLTDFMEILEEKPHASRLLTIPGGVKDRYFQSRTRIVLAFRASADAAFRFGHQAA